MRSIIDIKRELNKRIQKEGITEEIRNTKDFKMAYPFYKKYKKEVESFESGKSDKIW